MRRFVFVLLVLAALAGPRASAQRQQRDPGIPVGFSPVDWAVENPIQTGFYRLPGISGDYLVGPGDELEVFITGYSDKSVSVRVSNTGAISIPLVGTIAVSDVTTTEIENRIVRALIDKGLVREPDVLVHVAEHLARPIYVLGDVDFPGQYMMSQQLTLMEAIFLAGGLDFPAARYGYLHRRIDGATGPAPTKALLERADVPLPGHSVTRIDLQPLKEGGVLDPDITLRPHDVVAIPRRQSEIFYVIGDVTTAGSYEIPNQRTLKVSQALAYAGGPAKSAKASQSIVIRLAANGERTELPVDFDAILRGEKDDFDVRGNDIIFVPGATIRNFSTGLLRVVPGLLRTALIYY